MASLTPRQERIKKRHWDQLKTLLYTSKRNDELSEKIMNEIVVSLDETIEGEIDMAMALRRGRK